MTKRMFIMFGLVLVLVALLGGGFYLHIKKLMASAPKLSAQTVTTTKVSAVEWQPQISSVGTVTPYRGVDVTTEIGGLIREVKFKSGATVHKGDVLFVLNADSDTAQLRSLEAAAELAATVLKRDEAQLAIEGVSQAHVDADRADLKAKRATVDGQRALVEKKTIRAPFSGRLGITAINPGQFVNPGDKLVSLQTVDPIFVNFSIPQKQSAQIKLNQNVNITSDSFIGMNFVGKVSTINPIVDASTRNILVQAQLSNDKQQLLPGMFANVSVDVGAKAKYITLPQTALTFNPYGTTVFIVKQGTKKDEKGVETPDKDEAGNTKLVVNQVFVTTGPARGDQISIIKGLEEGQEVVTSGQLKLKNGTWIRVDNSVLPANDQNPTPQEH